jgi:hypothetical protein
LVVKREDFTSRLGDCQAKGGVKTNFKRACQKDVRQV